MNRLSILNFGPVKKAELELRSINLLIGEQSIGKSTIAKLIAIFTDSVGLSMLAAKGIKMWRTRLIMSDLNIFDEGDYSIKYELEEKGFSLCVRVNRHRVLFNLVENGKKVTDKNKVSEVINLRIKLFRRADFWEMMKTELTEGQDKDPRYQVIALQSLIESSLYVPAERIAYSVQDSLKSALSIMGDTTTFTYNRFMVSLDKAKKRLKRYESPLLKITYLNEDKGQFFEDAKSKKKYHLFNASSGIQSTIPLLLVLEDVKNRDYSSIVIEEPETNLYPNTQIDVLKLILQKTRVSGRIVTITTHSPYLLSALNNFLYAGFVAKSINNAEVLNSILPEELRLDPEECSVYSIGESINDNGAYCESLIDTEMGMIRMNTLDKVSYGMSEEFEKIQDCFIKNS